MKIEAGALKRLLAPKMGVSRFRLRLLLEGSSQCLQDEDHLELPMALQLVILQFAQNEPSQNVEFMSACASLVVSDARRSSISVF